MGDKAMPAFFADLPTIVMRDPLAQFLGTAEGGRLEYSYVDAVKLTGHSCPTVAGAYLATAGALTRLYAGEVPVRGGIRVEMRERLEEGVTGVVAGVVGLITGAAAEGGFKGIAGRFVRRGLLAYGVALESDMRFTRLDNGASVEVNLDPAPPASGALRQALGNALSAGAGESARRAFAQAWQARVAAMVTPR
jgi:hypothetical protein